MAKAPTPGHAAKKRRRQSGFRVTLGEDVYTLYLADIGAPDEMLVRQQAGASFSQILGGGGMDTAAVIVWLARRKRGEKKLALRKVLDDFPSFEELQEMDEAGEFDIDQFEPEPPADDDEVDDDDPLPSAGG